MCALGCTAAAARKQPYCKITSFYHAGKHVVFGEIVGGLDVLQRIGVLTNRMLWMCT